MFWIGERRRAKRLRRYRQNTQRLCHQPIAGYSQRPNGTVVSICGRLDLTLPRMGVRQPHNPQVQIHMEFAGGILRSLKGSRRYLRASRDWPKQMRTRLYGRDNISLQLTARAAGIPCRVSYYSVNRAESAAFVGQVCAYWNAFVNFDLGSNISSSTLKSRRI